MNQPSSISLPADAARLDKHRIVLRNLERIRAAKSALDLIAAYGCSAVDVLGGARHKWTARCRRHIWLVLRHTLDLSYPEIGAVFGCDHTSVMYGVRKAQTEMEDRLST